jgi:hypothetical protein
MTPSVQIAGGRRVTRWSRETIITKIVEWHDRHGEPPCSADWNPSLARWRAQEWRIERYRDGRWPSTNAVKRTFDGSFDAAVRAAGLEPRRPGPPRPSGEATPSVVSRDPANARVLGARIADAEARTRAALDQARAAGRHAAEAQRALAAAQARAARAEAALAALARATEATEGEPGAGAGAVPLTAAELAALREACGAAGPAVLAGALKALARARAAGDRPGLAIALGDVAAAAVRWRDRL